MANDFDQFPVYDPLVKSGTLNMSDVWNIFMGSFFQNLIGYLSQFGIFLPQLTTAQRDSIQKPVNGQIIYNTTLNTAQYFKAGVWTSI
jgi:hypothetical protein